MFNVVTNHPIALDSDDHNHPDGVHLDNYCNPQFIFDIEKYFDNKKIDFLDLGCAGGGLTVGLLERGHNALGLEGSDHCLNIKSDVIDKLGSMPLGYQNWVKYGNTNLFTCDITYDFTIIKDAQLQQFDLITCLDVMEHFYEERIDKFLEMVCKHLKPNGLFIAVVALFHLEKNKILEEGNVIYHKSLFTHEQWCDIYSKYFEQKEYPFTCTNRDMRSGNDHLYLLYAGVKK